MGNQHIVPFSIKINKEKRQKLSGHGSTVLWFTRLFGSVKLGNPPALQVVMS